MLMTVTAKFDPMKIGMKEVQAALVELGIKPESVKMTMARAEPSGDQAEPEAAGTASEAAQKKVTDAPAKDKQDPGQKHAGKTA